MKKKKKGVFSKIIVVFCVLEMAFLQFWAMKIADSDSFLTTGLLTANHAVFGGELLLLCLKRLLTDETVMRQTRKNTKSSKKKITNDIDNDIDKEEILNVDE